MGKALNEVVKHWTTQNEPERAEMAPDEPERTKKPGKLIHLFVYLAPKCCIRVFGVGWFLQVSCCTVEERTVYFAMQHAKCITENLRDKKLIFVSLEIMRLLGKNRGALVLKWLNNESFLLLKCYKNKNCEGRTLICAILKRFANLDTRWFLVMTKIRLLINNQKTAGSKLERTS